MNRRNLLIGGAILCALPNAAFAQAYQPTRFSVRTVGQGPDVILIPGLTCQGAVWDETVAQLAPRFRCHVLTLSGFGSPAGPNAEGPVIEPVVAEIANLIRAGGLKSPAIIGHSIGGFMGLRLAIAHGDLIGRVMIVDSYPSAALMFMLNPTPAQALVLATRLKANVLAMAGQAAAPAQPAQGPSMTKVAARQPLLDRWGAAADQRVVAQCLYDVTAADARPDLPKVRKPVTMLHAYDPAIGFSKEGVDGRIAGMYAGLPGVKLVRVDNAAHFIMWDQPEVFQAEVERFLA